MADNLGPQKIISLIASKMPTAKPPAYEWQDLALTVIKELSIPNFKRNSVFRVCKNNPKELVEKAVNETKELCRSGEKWKYFFKVIDDFIKSKNN